MRGKTIAFGIFWAAPFEACTFASCFRTSVLHKIYRSAVSWWSLARSSLASESSGAELKCPLELRLSFRILPLHGEDATERIVRGGIVGFQVDRTPGVHGRFIDIAVIEQRVG